MRPGSTTGDSSRPAPQEAEYVYWAFLSYSRSDEKWGLWLHRALENYRLPRRLVGRELPGGGKAPVRIRPVFRDKDELAAESSLGEPIRRALKQSRRLVVDDGGELWRGSYPYAGISTPMTYVHEGR